MKSIKNGFLFILILFFVFISALKAELNPKKILLGAGCASSALAAVCEYSAYKKASSQDSTLKRNGFKNYLIKKYQQAHTLQGLQEHSPATLLFLVGEGILVGAGIHHLFALKKETPQVKNAPIVPLAPNLLLPQQQPQQPEKNDIPVPHLVQKTVEEQTAEAMAELDRAQELARQERERTLTKAGEEYVRFEKNQAEKRTEFERAQAVKRQEHERSLAEFEQNKELNQKKYNEQLLEKMISLGQMETRHEKDLKELEEVAKVQKAVARREKIKRAFAFKEEERRLNEHIEAIGVQGDKRVCRIIELYRQAEQQRVFQRQREEREIEEKLEAKRVLASQKFQTDLQHAMQEFKKRIDEEFQKNKEAFGKEEIERNARMEEINKGQRLLRLQAIAEVELSRKNAEKEGDDYRNKITAQGERRAHALLTYLRKYHPDQVDIFMRMFSLSRFKDLEPVELTREEIAEFDCTFLK